MKTETHTAKEPARKRFAPAAATLLAIMILCLAGCASEETSQRPWNRPDNAAAAADTERAQRAPEMARLEMEKERLRGSEEAARRMQGRDAPEPAPQKTEL